ncbi:MAG: DUF448 domain-containing protein [Campylobacterota bacterium]|nr:DUF448 domain-containing protein [Campylobacterota bacterium]
MKMSKPIRMCISCRQRAAQKTMIRLQQESNQIIKYRGYGRSFYLCYECVNNEKKVKGLTKRFKQDEERFVKFLKELIKNG